MTLHNMRKRIRSFFRGPIGYTGAPGKDAPSTKCLPCHLEGKIIDAPFIAGGLSVCARHTARFR